MKTLPILILLAAPLSAQQPKPVRPDTNTVTIFRGVEPEAIKFQKGPNREDTLTIKKLAVEHHIDTAKAQLRFVADTAWIWSRRPDGSTGMRLVRANARWLIHKIEDTTTAVPKSPPVHSTTF